VPSDLADLGLAKNVYLTGFESRRKEVRASARSKNAEKRSYKIHLGSNAA
jgi:hypothetical protein